MPSATPLPVDDSKPIGINFVGKSPHVFVYRFWKKAPTDTEFVVICDGDTTDNVPDHFDTGPHPKGTRIAYWVAVAGKANSAFRFSVIFAQGGQIPAGGDVEHNGKTSADGGAVVENEVVLT